MTLILTIMITLVAMLYMGIAIFFQSHFCFGTTVDGVNVGGCDAKEAEARISRKIRRYSLTLTMREAKSEKILGSSISLTPVFDDEMSRLIQNQSGFAWLIKLFQKEKLTLDKVVTYDKEALETEIQKLSCMKQENQRAPSSATYLYQEGVGYIPVKADYGTTIDQKAFREAVRKAILSVEEELILEEAGCYQEPPVGDDHPQLAELLDELNRYTSVTITYRFGEKSERLGGNQISQWLSAEEGSVAIDEAAVYEYIKELAGKYNTAYTTKTLETSYGRSVTISGGSYGWKIDNEKEVRQLLADLAAGRDVEREPIYAQRANSHEGNDYGDSYVEINLTAQHLFLYQNGQLVVESDFVSGNVARGYSTPTGVFPVTYKTRNAVLRGEDYATPVKYWMPFAGDVGMHDASWRKSFGGEIYLTNGSHGCINLPSSVAKIIYETISQGYAVLVYTLPGTESGK
ncbi:MAG: peptidoglycan binding domain-containing protein [Clostridiales bacterium]|nr:peptidoglycan binding domain-containing protein [Clostridiales bacterium]